MIFLPLLKIGMYKLVFGLSCPFPFSKNPEKFTGVRYCSAYAPVFFSRPESICSLVE